MKIHHSHHNNLLMFLFLILFVSLQAIKIFLLACALQPPIALILTEIIPYNLKLLALMVFSIKQVLILVLLLLVFDNLNKSMRHPDYVTDYQRKHTYDKLGNVQLQGRPIFYDVVLPFIFTPIKNKKGLFIIGPLII